MNERVPRELKAGVDAVTTQQRVEAIRRYQDEEDNRSRTNIETAVNQRYEATEERMRRISKDLFVLPTGVELTDDEMADVERFIMYAGKRIVHAEQYAPMNADRPNEKPDDFSPYGDHDLTHSIAAYMREGATTPEFLRSEELYESPKVIAEEMLAALWSETRLGNAFMQVITPGGLEGYIQRMAKDSATSAEAVRNATIGLDTAQNFEDALHAYRAIIREIIRMDAESHGAGDRVSAGGQFDAAYDEATRQLEPVFFETARNIFDHHDEDPKILFHEFQRACKPLLGRLQKSREYNDGAVAQRHHDVEEAKRRLAALRDDF